MNGITVLLAMAAVGVDYGWRPGADGQLEYIIQLEPAALEALKNGKDITSEIHPDARNVRRFRICVGTGALPRVNVLSDDTSPTRLSTSDTDLTRAPGAGRGGMSSITDEGGSAAGGLLNLPPPPALLGPDGKVSVLVRPGDRALPGAAASSDTSMPSYDSAPPANSPASTLSVPSSGSSNWEAPTTPPSVPAGAPSGGFGPQPSSGIFPVPAAGPETGLPEPIRGAGVRRGSATDRVAEHKQPDDAAAATGMLGQLADNRGNGETAAQKPTIDKETAERLKEEMRAEQPWAPLVLTSLALFGSLAGNLYLGWIASGIYRRYRDMCDELHEAQASLT